MNYKKHLLHGLFFTLLFSLLLHFGNRAFGSHAMATDIYYECLNSPNQYEFTVKFYRDCSGISAPSSITLNMNSNSCGVSQSFTLNQQSSREVSQLCPTATSTCNGGTEPGVEEYIYSGTVNLPAQCPDWRFSYSICCRNGAIDNLASTGTFYVERTLDNTGGLCNNSVRFNTIPVQYLCANQPYCFNHSAYDPDGDSIAYEIVYSKDGSNAGDTIPFASGYSMSSPVKTTPAGAFQFDSTNGTICFTPSTNQYDVISMRIKEYRNGNLIGTTVREMQLIIRNCSNAIPQPDSVVSNLTNAYLDSNGVVHVCSEDSIVIQTTAMDSNNNNVTMSSNAYSNFQGASFDSSCVCPTPKGTFVWEPTVSDTGRHTLLIKLRDDGCPINGQNYYEIDIQVDPGIKAGPNQYYCPGLPGVPLTLIGRPDSVVWSPATGLSCTQCKTPLASPSQTTTYTVNNYGTCSATDSITVIVDTNNALTVTPTDTFTCPGDSMPVQAVATGPLACGAYGSSCSSLDTNQIGSGALSTTDGTPYGGNYEDGRVQFLYHKSELNAMGLTGSGTITRIAFNVTSKLSSQPYHNFTIKMGCTYKDNLSAGEWLTGLDVVYGPNAVVTSSGWNYHTLDVPYNWDGKSHIIVQICFNSTSSSNLGDDAVEADLTGFTSVVYDQADGEVGCFLSDPSTALLRPNTRFSYCQADSTSFDYLWQPAAGVSDTTAMNPMITPTQSSYVVTAYGGICPMRDTIDFSLGPYANIDSMGDATCQNNNGFASVAAQGGSGNFNYQWNDPNSQTTQTANNLPPGNYQVIVTDAANGCTDTATVYIDSTSAPRMNATVQDVSCQGGNNGAIYIDSVYGGTTPYNYSWSTGGTGSSEQNLVAGTYVVTLSDSVGCSRIDSFTVQDGIVFTTDAFPDTSVCEGASVNLGVSSGSFFNWIAGTSSLSCSDCGTPTASPTNTTTYIVEVWNADSCKTTDSVTVQVAPLPAPSISANTVCEGEETQFQGSTSTGSIDTWSWDFGDGTTSSGQNTNHKYNSSGTYTVDLSITDQNGCQSSTTKTVTVAGQPNADFDAQPQIASIEQPEIQFKDKSTDDAVKWTWYLGNGDSVSMQHPMYSYEDTGTYQVMLFVENQNGCMDSTVGTITILPGFNIYIPNAFTPNGDELNDKFMPVGTLEGIQNYEMQIWNQWGEMIFKTSNPHEGWNGKLHNTGKTAQNDTYVYIITLTDFMGNEHNYEGYVHLVR